MPGMIGTTRFIARSQTFILSLTIGNLRALFKMVGRFIPIGKKAHALQLEQEWIVVNG